MAGLMALAFTSCEKINGKGGTISETRYETGYTGISLAMSATVYYTQDSVYSLEITGQQNVIDRIVTEVEGSDLVIKLKKGVHLGAHDPVSVFITAPEVRSLNISGSGNLYAENLWEGDDLSVNISGSGDLSVSSLWANRFHANISGSGDIQVLNGQAGWEELKISGSGTIDVRNVSASEVYTTTSGSGDTYVQASSLLDVTISGSGNVWYLGTPVINTHISGSGNIRRL